MEFDDVVLQIAENLKRTLIFIPDEIKQKCEEIRLRAELPVCLTISGKTFFVCNDSTVCNTQKSNVLIASKEDITKTLSLLCRHSIYLYENEIKQGFISLPNGGRAGVCGVFNAEGMLVSVQSINIRIARQIFDCARQLLPYAKGGLLIAGPPGCGKTTMLRDLVRLLSSGADGNYYRVAVIDSRGEISGGGRLDLGVNTDILRTADKSIGTEIALRTMFPQFIAFDEIGTTAELKSVSSCFNAGVNIITTTHVRDKHDLINREIIRKLIDCNAVFNVAVLSQKTGESIETIPVKELKKCDYV